jgi:TetR/AcrR family transcriptional regulator, transcriptional repressor for nem operon
MARVVKEEEYAVKVNEILDTAQHLFFTKGYERMTISDILEALQISKGAFYHYFESKAAVLGGFIERIQQGVETALLPIIHAPDLTAIEKFHSFFGTLDHLRFEHRAAAIELMRVWYTDENAIVRAKVDDAVIVRRAPLLNEIVQQGLREGVFTTTHPDRAGEVIQYLLNGMANSHIKLFLALDEGADEQATVDEIIAVYAAYMDAVERVLGAPEQSLHRIDVEAVRMWVNILKTEGKNIP